MEKTEQKTEQMNLSVELSRFTGSENYYRILSSFNYYMTDGVKYFCEKAQADWFVTDVFFEVLELKKKTRDYFFSVVLYVSDKKAFVEISDGNKKVHLKQKYEYTDCPPGIYKFFFVDNVLMLKSEY